MVRKRAKPDISTSDTHKPMSSDDLLKQAWESMGRLESGERTGDSSTSRSAEMTSAANVSSTASSEQRESAEEIAQLLAREAQNRRAAEQRPQPAPRRRQSSPEPRERRTQPLRAPRSEDPSPQPVPTQPQQQQQPPASQWGRPGRSRKGIVWLVFGLIWVISAVIGVFAEDNSTSTPDISIDIPDVTVDFSDLTSTTLDAAIDGDNVTLLSIRDLAPGTCVATLPLDDIIEDVATVPCSEAHQYELFANTELAGGDHPGDDIFSQAFDECDTQFFDYVGEAYGTSEWYIDVITPTEEGWNSAGDREVRCLLYLWDEEDGVIYVTGTARGSGATG